MSGIQGIINAAMSAIKSNAKALEVAGANIANVSTEGYTKQRPTFQASASDELGVGSGVSISGLERVYNHFTEIQLTDSIESKGRYGEEQRHLSEIEDIFNESDDSGVSNGIISYFNSWSALAANPVGITERQNLIDNAVKLSNDFKRAYTFLKDLKYSVNEDFGAIVKDLNVKLEAIAGINYKLKAKGPKGDNLNELIDQRNKLVNDVAELGDVKVIEDENAFTLLFGNAVVVEDSYCSTISTKSDVEGNLSLWISASPKASKLEITDRVQSGKLRGIITTRDETIPTYLEALDKIAYSLMKEVNQQHKLGFGLDGSTNRNFFTDYSSQEAEKSWKYAAVNLNIQSDLINNPQGIAAASDLTQIPNGNTNALDIVGLNNKDIFLLNNLTFQGSYSTLLQKVGSDSNSAKINSKVSADFYMQMKIRREGIAGVNMDEEATNLIIYQKAYQGAAKLLQISAELMDILANI